MERHRSTEDAEEPGEPEEPEESEEEEEHEQDNTWVSYSNGSAHLDGSGEIRFPGSKQASMPHCSIFG